MQRTADEWLRSPKSNSGISLSVTGESSASKKWYESSGSTSKGLSLSWGQRGNVVGELGCEKELLDFDKVVAGLPTASHCLRLSLWQSSLG